MKKTRTKDEFIEECNKQMANICDPKRSAAKRCKKGSKRYSYMERQAIMKKRRPRNA